MIEHANVTINSSYGSSLVEGTTVIFNCGVGYRLLPPGNNAIVCAENGEWENEVGKCYTGK